MAVGLGAAPEAKEMAPLDVFHYVTAGRPRFGGGCDR